MTPMQAIQSATISAAQLMQWEDRVGSLAPGKFADIIAVDGDALADLHSFMKVGFVMKGGVVYKGSGAAVAERALRNRRVRWTTTFVVKGRRRARASRGRTPIADSPQRHRARSRTRTTNELSVPLCLRGESGPTAGSML